MNILNLKVQNFFDWGLGIGDWGLGIGDWAQSPIPNPQSTIPKSPIPNQKNFGLLNLKYS